MSALHEHSKIAARRDADLVERVEKWANDGKTVLVSALDATFQVKPFMNVLHLIPLAENVIKLTAICTGCRKEASFTKRLSSETDVEVSLLCCWCWCNTVLCRARKKDCLPEAFLAADCATNMTTWFLGHISGL